VQTKLVILSAAMFAAPFLSAQTQTCSNATLNGTYLYSFGGSVKSLVNANNTSSYNEQGKLMFNGAGSISGTSATSTAGVLIGSNTVTGSYSISTNCTGTATLTTGTQVSTLALQIYDGGADALVSATTASTGELGSGHFYRVASASGSQCGNGSAQGVYAVNLDGGTYVGTTRTAYENQGQLTFNGNGGVSVTGEISTATVVATPWNGTGSYSIAADCTGTLQISTAFGAQSFAIAKNSGGGIIMQETDASTTVNGTATPQAIADVLPQLAFGGGWYTALYFTNSNSNTVTFTVTFTADNGTPLAVPGVGTSQVVTLGPQGTTIIQALNQGTLQQGYVSVALPAGVSAYGVFRQSVPGSPDQEAVVNFRSATSTAESLIFDDTGLATSVAIVNPSTVAATVTITAWGPTGNMIGTSTMALPAGNKVENVLSNFPGLSALVGQRGAALFTVTQGNVSVLGVRFNGTAFTSTPVTTEQ
jgi:hypothetical protein